MDNNKNNTPGWSLFNYSRRKSCVVKIGGLNMGGENPIRVQSMANTDTNDTENSVAQCIRIAEAGGELVRFTAQGVKEAANLQFIHSELRKRGCDVPLVADIHFNPRAAETAALYVEKVRINPGNFVDSVHTQKRFEYTDEEYALEIQKIKDKLIPFLQICRENGTAVRIGVNHGSLSDRILSRYGDTPKGMVESCLEFLRVCKEVNFNDIVISIKASNTVVMVQTVRLLTSAMQKENMNYPLHLGVTEAGDGEDGRVKSAVGIGALLADGIGDTIRVSLSEDPEREIPVAKSLVDYVAERDGHEPIVATDSKQVSPFFYCKRKTSAVRNIGGGNVPVVISNSSAKNGDLSADFVYSNENGSIADFSVWSKADGAFPLFRINEVESLKFCDADLKFLELSYNDLNDKIYDFIDEKTVFVLTTDHKNGVGEQRAFIHALLSKNIQNPVILKRSYADGLENLQIKSAADLGVFFIDGLADGIWIDAPNVSGESLVSLSFGILQASRVRVSKTEYISCPSCGRTLFDLQRTIARVKEKTSHLKGLKIGIMGCIVNGPGEMADADYGYVGSARGKINLYKGQTCIEKVIPEEEAVDRLIQLIKENGDWQ